MDYRKEIQELRRTLTENGYLYYVLDAPTMSDYEYDHLLRRLEDLEAAHPEEITPDSPTQRVGGQTLTEFQQVTHAVPLESLQDVFDDEEVCRFLEKIPLKHPAYSVEPKVDGLSVALEYRDGVFVRGATRGDGRVGEDVTENLRTIRSIPMTLPEKLPRLIVRGEVYMARSVFEEINARREIEGKPLMANPRNAAAGSLRQLDPKIAAQRRLDIAVFNLQLAEGREFSTHTETIDYLASQHFKVIPHKRLSAPSDILAEIAALGDGREQFPFDIDGAVVKLDDLHDREIIGSTAKFPKWAIAYKYPPEVKPSVVKDIVVQVGRTGVLSRCGWRARRSPLPRCITRIILPRRISGWGIRCWCGRPARSSRRSLRWWRTSVPPGRSPIPCPRRAPCAAHRWYGTRTARRCAAPARSALPSCCGT